MQRLIRLSRFLVPVITTDWIKSNFTDYEIQLKFGLDASNRRTRIVPLLVDAVEPPEALKDAVCISVKAVGERAALVKLADALIGSLRSEKSRLDSRMILWRDFGSNQGTPHNYRGKLIVFNPTPVGSGIEFDTILVRTHIPPDQHTHPHQAQAVWIRLTDKGITSIYQYDRPTDSDIPPGLVDATSRLQSIEPGMGIGLPNIGFGTLRSTIAGKHPVTVSVCLYRGARPVTGLCWAVLPPVSRLRLFRGPEETDQTGFTLNFLEDQYLSRPTGIHDHSLIQTILATAGKFTKDALLVSVDPVTITVHEFSGGAKLHVVNEWTFTFYSETIGGKFQISPSDPTWLDSADISPQGDKPERWLSEDIFRNVWLDAGMAYSLARETGCVFAAGLPFRLEASGSAGIWRPLWHLPMVLGERPAAVFADTGELVAEVGSGGTFEKPFGIIWNA